MSKINPLLLAAAVGGGIYLISKKDAKASTSTSTIGTDVKGYRIDNCSKIIVKDEKKAFQYAYNVGKFMGPAMWDILLFDGCVGKKYKSALEKELAKESPDISNITNILKNPLFNLSKDPKIALFLFDLDRYMTKGRLDKGDINQEQAAVIIENNKKIVQNQGIDTATWDSSIPDFGSQIAPPEEEPKPNPQIDSVVVGVDENNFQQEVENSSLPVFITFGAEWCPACQAAAPIIDKLSLKYLDKLKFVYVDTDESPDLAKQFEVETIPTFITYKNGIVGKLTGKTDEQSIDNFINS